MVNKTIAYQRLYNQGVSWTKEVTPYDVVKKLGAVQAQNYSQALWAIGLRTQGANISIVEQAIAEKEIVLTWAMRGTLHFVAAEDIRWMINLLSPRMLIKARKRLEQLKFDSKQIEFGEQLIYGALRNNERMSRSSLMEVLDEGGIDTQNGRGYHLLWYLAQKGQVCLAPLEKKQQIFVWMENWLNMQQNSAPADPLGALARRYFTGHGPATAHDFAWWSGLTIIEANQGIKEAQEHLISEKIEGLQYWTSKEKTPEIKQKSTIHLLSGYDEYLLGYKDRRAVLKEEYAPLIAGKNAVFASMLIIDGEIAGIWKRVIKKQGLNIAIHPFYRLETKKEYILDKVQQYSRFVNVPVSQIVINDI